MSHAHAHGAQAFGPPREGQRKALRTALILTGTFTVVEVVGGVLTGSLALLADAAHMLSDNGSLALALFAIWLAQRPPTARRSFGYQRAEVLAALVNGLTLAVVSGWILYQAVDRLDHEPDVLGGPMLAVAVGGLLVNLAAVRILHGAEGESVNVSAALRHVVADLAGSVGVILASLIIIFTGWDLVDPIVGGLIGLLVVASAWPVLRDSIAILLEQAPAAVDPEEVGREMCGIVGVVEVHDLHIWTITSGFPALSAHVTIRSEADRLPVRAALERRLHDHFGIEHTTLQIEPAGEEGMPMRVEVDRPT